MADENAGNNPENSNGQDGGDGGKTIEKVVPHGAFHEEREKRKAAEAKIAAYEAKEKESQEKKLQEEGNYKELIAQKEKELNEYKSTAEAKLGQLSQYEEKAQKNIEAKIASLGEEDKAFVQNILSGKSILEQNDILPDLLNRLGGGKQTLNPSPADSQKTAKTANLEAITAKEKLLEELKKKADAMGVLRVEREIAALKAQV